MIYFIDSLPKRLKSFGEFDGAISFAYEYLNLPYDLELDIEFSGDMSDNTQGEADYEYNTATITLNKKIKKVELIPTLFHEMVHIKQMLDGDLIVGIGNERTKWKGEHFQGDYYDYPWEVDAFQHEENMVKLYMENTGGIYRTS